MRSRARLRTATATAEAGSTLRSASSRVYAFRRQTSVTTNSIGRTPRRSESSTCPTSSRTQIMGRTLRSWFWSARCAACSTACASGGDEKKTSSACSCTVRLWTTCPDPSARRRLDCCRRSCSTTADTKGSGWTKPLAASCEKHWSNSRTSITARQKVACYSRK